VDTLTREQLIIENGRLTEKLVLLEAKVNWLMEQFKLAQHRQFGSSSEKSSALLQNELVFDEAEAILDSVGEVVEPQTITYTRKGKSEGHRQEILRELPTEIREYRLPEDEQVCSQCGSHTHEMSTQVRDELVIIPAQVKVIKHVRYVYGCRHCDRNEISVPIVTAPGPAPFIPKSLASASAVAYIMSQKFVESMPLYRIEKHFERLGVDLPRQVLSNWMLKGGEKLEVIYDHLHERLLELDILHADESSLQVLREPGRPAQSKSFMWLYRSGRDGPPIVLFEYQPTRSGEHPKRFLPDFTGYLQVDGYAGYHDVKSATLAGCWAHVRRGFTDALNIVPKEHREDPAHLSNVALIQIAKLYKIEKELENSTHEERKVARENRSKPIVEQFKVWLDRQSQIALPKSKIGQAIGYCQNQWAKLIQFLEDGRLEIDNNRAERSIKPFVIGRKNWLFANTPRGAKTSAIIYSIVETAKENGLNPSAYLQYLFERLPEIDPTDAAAIDSLLPWNDTVQSALQAQRSLPLK
jgi:transposase